MKAVVYDGPRQVSVKEVPDARIERPTDVLVRITSANICGSDLHMYEGRTDFETGRWFGHENLGQVVEVGECAIQCGEPHQPFAVRARHGGEEGGVGATGGQLVRGRGEDRRVGGQQAVVGQPGRGRASSPRVSTTPASAVPTILAILAISCVRSRSSAITLVTAPRICRSARLRRAGSSTRRLTKPTCRPVEVNSAPATPPRKPAGSWYSPQAHISGRGTGSSLASTRRWALLSPRYSTSASAPGDSK